MFRKLASLRRDSRGIAAIEMAFIMPFLLLLYFGLVDLTALITLNRKITYSASVVADLVTQNDSTVAATDIEDYVNAVALAVKPRPISYVSVEVYQFRSVSGTITNQWSKKSTGSGGDCGTPSTSGMSNLMTDGNDIVVAVVCTTYEPYIATFLGSAILGATSFNVSDQIALRPRQSSTLDCPTCDP